MRPVLRAVAYIVIPVAASLLLLISGHGEAAVIVLTVFVLIVTTILLQAATIGPAELSVQRQHELGYSDLIFYLTTDAPRDILLQMHVAVINTGGRKGVLSKLELQEFRDGSGAAVRPYQMPFPLAARVFRQSGTYGFAGGQSIRQTRIETSSPPVILEPPHDVFVCHYRSRICPERKPPVGSSSLPVGSVFSEGNSASARFPHAPLRLLVARFPNVG